MTYCLPARVDLATLESTVDEYRTSNRDLEAARTALAADFGFPGWDEIYAEVERRAILNARDVSLAQERISVDPSWATRDLRNWCDHRHGAAPINYMAMLRFDADRLGLDGPLDGTDAMARLVLEAGASPDGAAEEDETPLMTAASYGDADVARVLVEAGADLEATAGPDAGGVPNGTALRHAAVFGMTDVLDVLVAAGARVGTLREAAAAGDISGWPLEDADELERLRALIMAADHQHLPVIDALLEAGTPIDAVDPDWGRQALRLAAEHGRPASTRHLLDRGADPTLADEHGHTALDLCRGEPHRLPGRHHDEVAEILRAALASTS